MAFSSLGGPASSLLRGLLILAKSGVMLGQSGEMAVDDRLVVQGFVFGGDAGLRCWLIEVLGTLAKLLSFLS